jgi:hypothetical protein
MYDEKYPPETEAVRETQVHSAIYRLEAAAETVSHGLAQLEKRLTHVRNSSPRTVSSSNARQVARGERALCAENR